MDPLSTSTYQTHSFDDISITSSTTDSDEFFDADSFIYNPTSVSSNCISSYKTEKSVISTNSRTNHFSPPRDICAGTERLKLTQGPVSLGVEGASVLEALRDESEEATKTTRTREGSMEAHQSGSRLFQEYESPSLKHPDVECFNCQQDIVGARFHCVDCTMVNIDICSNCESVGLPGNLDASDGGHSSSHVMLKIPMPLNMHEVQDVSQRAHALRHGRDHADLRGLSPLMRSSPSSVSFISANTILYGNGAGADIEEGYIDLQICNSCGRNIVGVRYQCLNCPSKPSSYNFCSVCEVESYRVHNPMHVFLKIPRPVDIPGPLQSEFPFIPILYREPAGPAPTNPSAELPSDPADYLRNLTHAFALCDLHMLHIVGKWYRCAFCAKDLCADCKSFDTHDGTHAFLVFKAPVDMHAFRRHFADLDNPSGISPPVLRGNIYYPRHE